LESRLKLDKTLSYKPHDEYLRLYTVAQNNAAALLSEAQILLEREKYIRAFFLGLTALEEIAKSQLAADVFTGFASEKEFQDHYWSHKKKIGRMAWATQRHSIIWIRGETETWS